MRGLLATTAAFTLTPMQAVRGESTRSPRTSRSPSGPLGPQRRLESDQQLVWDPLRSHPPNLPLDGSELLTGRLATGASMFWGVGLSLTYGL